MRTIPNISNLFKPVEETIRHHLLPAILGGHQVNDVERNLLSLPPKYGGLGIRITSNASDIEYENSRFMTSTLRNTILGKANNDVNEETNSKNKIKSERIKKHKATLENIRSQMNDTEKRINDANQECGAYNWLTCLPIKEHGYDLTKKQFWDALGIRYGWTLPRLPSECSCRSKFSLAHAMACKKGGFISLRHNEIWNITGQLLSEVCHDVRIEPLLTEITTENFVQKSTIMSNEARLDVSARGFWVPGQRVFCDVRIFNLDAHRGTGTPKSKNAMREMKLKRKTNIMSVF